MNWKNIKNDLLKRRVGNTPYAARVRALIVTVGRHIKKQAKVKKVAHVPLSPTNTSQWKLMSRAIRDGRRIVAFDAEWQYNFPNKITELGMAILEDGKITVHNIRLRPGGKPFHGGETVYMDEEAAKLWLMSKWQGTGLIVGHALRNDRAKLKEFGFHFPPKDEIPVVDTATWSRVMSETNNPMRLSHFAKLHGIESKGAHVAGNDAKMTLEVAMKLAEMTE